MASGRNVVERAAHIVQLRDPGGLEAQRTQRLNSSISRSAAVAVAGKSREEDQQVSITEKITRTPTIAPAARLCKTLGCKRTLAYNNRTGICGDCLSKKTKGILLAKRAAAAPAKPNGVDHHDPVHGNGNGAPPDPMRLLVMPRPSRVDLLLQAIPIEDKTKMLSAWIAGKF